MNVAKRTMVCFLDMEYERTIRTRNTTSRLPSGLHRFFFFALNMNTHLEICRYRWARISYRKIQVDRCEERRLFEDQEAGRR